MPNGGHHFGSGKSFPRSKTFQNMHFCETDISKTTSRNQPFFKKWIRADKAPSFVFRLFTNNQNFHEFYKKELLLRCPKLIWIAKREYHFEKHVLSWFPSISNLYIAGDVRSRRYMNRQRFWLVTLHRFSFLFETPHFLFDGFIEIWCFSNVKTLAIIITSGNDM